MMLRIVLVRAVNVGGARMPMADLCELATELGARDPVTYLASGNLIVDVDDPDDFDSRLERAVPDRFGFTREVISRSPSELRAARAAHPFAVDDEPKLHQIHFLQAIPTPTQIDAFAALGVEEPYSVIGRELHVRHQAGVAASRITPKTVLATLGSAVTARNLRTVDALLSMTGS